MIRRRLFVLGLAIVWISAACSQDAATPPPSEAPEPSVPASGRPAPSTPTATVAPESPTVAPEGPAVSLVPVAAPPSAGASLPAASPSSVVLTSGLAADPADAWDI